jgi:hypothetical protein
VNVEPPLEQGLGRERRAEREREREREEIQSKMDIEVGIVQELVAWE